MSARKYSPKATQRCSNCDRRGHNSRSKLCPSRVASECVAQGLVAFANELERKGGHGDIIEAARAAAEAVSS
jgi:hypothetical protein